MNGGIITGRIRGSRYELEHDEAQGTCIYRDQSVLLTLSDTAHQVLSFQLLDHRQAEHRVDLKIYLTLRYLLAGVLDCRFVNPINSRRS